MSDPKQNPVTQADFEAFKTELKTELTAKLTDLFDRLELKLIIRLSFVIFAAVGVAFIALVWLFDYKIDLTNEQHNERFSRIETILEISSPEAWILIENRIREKINNNQNNQQKKDKKLKKTIK